MSQRREVEARLALYDDLSGIIGAMRSFALTELQRVARREEAQQQVTQALSSALESLAPALPIVGAGGADVWLLFGSARGFCGSYNEDVLDAWRARAEGGPTVVVGDRLAGMMPRQAMFHTVQGAEGSLDAAAAIDRMLPVLSEARREADADAGLVALVGGEGGAQPIRLLPLPAPQGVSRAQLPLTNEPAPQVAMAVAEHFLFHSLLTALLRALHGENRLRLLQMENALRHLERGTEEFKRERNRLRQEEIVQEIELMAGHAASGTGALG